MRRGILALVTLTVAASVYAAPAGSITQGQLDGNTHPEVGALIAEYVQPGEKDVLCSGTLIAPTVFLTAGHCTEFLPSIGISRQGSHEPRSISTRTTCLRSGER